MRNIPGAPRDSRLGPVVLKSGGGAPSAPDPAATAQAQAEANARAIRESAKVNQVGINSPWGKQFWEGTIGQPDRELNIELTPGGERARQSQEQLAELLSGFGAETFGPQAIERLGAPDSDIGDMIYERAIGRREPEFRENEELLRSKLMTQGLSPGSRAYEQALGKLQRGEQFARDDLALSSTLSGFGENRAQRSQAINELSALLQGAPAIGSPATQMPAQYQVAPPDIAGLTMGNYYGQQGAYNSDASERAGIYGALGQLGAAGLGLLSDRRLKADIRPVGTHGGLRWYTYRYLWEGTRRLGVMAQEVLSVMPEAVFRAGPWLAVDYARILPVVGIPVGSGPGEDGAVALPVLERMVLGHDAIHECP